ncbi:MAG: outer membrane protein assembly factor BamE, partial [Gammaproteobacteria bacterium]
MRKLLIIHFALASLLLAACAQQTIPGVYRIDIQQGNVVTQDMLDRLETGMEKRKVRYLLGTPLIIDTFNSGRWDYLYSFQPGGGKRVQRRISL